MRDTGGGDAATRGHGERGGEATSSAFARDNSAMPDSVTSGDELPMFAGLLSPADKVVIAYVAIIAALILIFSFRIEHWPLLITGHALAIVLVVMIAKVGRRTTDEINLRVSASPRLRVLAFVRGWYPVALIPFTYKELTYLIPLVHPRDYDVEMAQIDRWMFGVDPTIWLERITTPLLTDVLQVIYTTYYFLPLILGWALWRNREFARFHFWVYIVAIGFYTSYIGYISVPVIGPRFLPLIKDAQSFPLSGALFDGELFRAIRETLDRAEGITRDCFPSGHTELTLLVLYYAHRFHRRMFWWMLPIGSAIIFSTVYLRYHYVIDVIAGAIVALAIILTAKPLYRWLSQGSGVRRQASGIGN